MLKKRIHAALIAVLLISASVVAVVIKPTQILAEQGESFDLHSAIPNIFGDWRTDELPAPITVTPEVRHKLDVLYSQVLNRTYINGKGQRVMLSIAYGSDQRDAVALHYPDICYPAQGFEIISRKSGQIRTAQGSIPVKRMETVQGGRLEPLTYWAMVGDYQTLGGIGKKVAEMRYGLRGDIPGGLLFRVSNIDRNSQDAFAVHDAFVTELLNSIDRGVRKRISGL